MHCNLDYTWSQASPSAKAKATTVDSQCVKITEKVSFWMDKKFIKNAKNSQFGEFLKTKACGQTVLPYK